jgi:hypothetical protein
MLQPFAILNTQRVVAFKMTVMDNFSSPHISSFVLRFVQENPEKLAAQPNYRGSIRHIQTDQEISFTRWIDALNFMSQFIPAEVFDSSEPSNLFAPDIQKSK